MSTSTKTRKGGVRGKINTGVNTNGKTQYVFRSVADVTRDEVLNMWFGSVILNGQVHEVSRRPRSRVWMLNY